MKTDVIKSMSTLTGVWSLYIDFDEKRYWDVEIDRPYKVEYDKNVLPSNSLFRFDVKIYSLFSILVAEI